MAIDAWLGYDAAAAAEVETQRPRDTALSRRRAAAAERGGVVLGSPAD